MIKLKFIPNSLVFGIRWNKPEIFILLGVFYVKIRLFFNKKQKRAKHEKIRHIKDDYFYYDDYGVAHILKLCK